MANDKRVEVPAKGSGQQGFNSCNSTESGPGSSRGERLHKQVMSVGTGEKADLSEAIQYALHRRQKKCKCKNTQQPIKSQGFYNTKNSQRSKGEASVLMGRG